MPDQPLPPHIYEWSPHRKGEPLFVSPNVRLCPACDDRENIHPLVDFRSNPKDANSFSVLCRKCVIKDREYRVEQAETNAIKVLTSTLAKATKRRTGGPSFQEVIESACAPMGGVEQAFQLTGKVFNKVLERANLENADGDDIDRAIKVGSTLINSAATCEKTKGPPVDLSGMTADEIQMILAEPAKQLILSDAEFRKQLLSDPDIRRLLLKDAGIEVIDTTLVEQKTSTPDEPGGELWQ